MKLFKLSFLALSSALALAALSPVTQAESIAYFTSSISPGITGTEQGRPSRNGVPQSWIGSETFPGIINTGITYDYRTYTFSSTLFTGAPYVDFSINDEANLANFFVSAYANSYNPANPSLNWLGDQGSSGNDFGTDAPYFDVILPAGASLVLVVNNTGANGAGINSLYDIAINAYADTNYNDPAPVPEPSTLITLGTGVVGLAAAARRRALRR